MQNRRAQTFLCWQSAALYANEQISVNPPEEPDAAGASESANIVESGGCVSSTDQLIFLRNVPSAAYRSNRWRHFLQNAADVPDKKCKFSNRGEGATCRARCRQMAMNSEPSRNIRTGRKQSQFMLMKVREALVPLNRMLRILRLHCMDN